MFNIGFTKRDLIRADWTFVFGVIGYTVLAQASIIDGTVDWKALLVGAVAAGLSALKNLVLSDGTLLKG